MKKAVVIFGVLIVLLWIAYSFLPYVMVDMITDYEPYTFESVTGDSVMRNDFGIGNLNKPGDYGFESEEINFPSLDGTMLNGWYVPCKKPSNRSILLIHGRTSNRLKTMKYLALVDSLNLDTLYNVFIPDFRNSGKSSPAKTFMGYKFGEDVTASLLLLHTDYRQDTFLLYGFSMGAMAILNAAGRPELKSKTAQLSIEGIILDSPLANVQETLQDQAGTVPLASIFFDKIFELYSAMINGFGENMKLSYLLDPTIPTLILQSKDDKTTKKFILDSELSRLKNRENLQVVYFEGPDHVRAFQDSQTRQTYIDAVRGFLLKNK